MGVFNKNYQVKFAILEPWQVWIHFHYPREMYETYLNMGYFDRLEHSILTEGILNPLMVSFADPDIYDMFVHKWEYKAGKIVPWNGLKCPRIIPFPTHYKKFYSIIQHSFGGARLYIAEKHDILIPCLISDFCGTVKEPEIITKKEILTYFNDLNLKEDELLFNDDGMSYKEVPVERKDRFHHRLNYPKFMENFDDSN